MVCCRGLINPQTVTTVSGTITAGNTVSIRTAADNAGRQMLITAVSLATVSGLTVSLQVASVNALVTSSVTFEASLVGDPALAITGQAVDITAAGGAGTGTYSVTYDYT